MLLKVGFQNLSHLQNKSSVEIDSLAPNFVRFHSTVTTLMVSAVIGVLSFNCYEKLVK